MDFLSALRPPFDPTHIGNWLDMPRLLPRLKTMRMDFVNFPRQYFQEPTQHLCELAASDLGGTVHKLMITGLPSDSVGRQALDDLDGLVEDNGLLLTSSEAFFHHGGVLVSQPDGLWVPRVIYPLSPFKAEIQKRKEMGEEEAKKNPIPRMPAPGEYVPEEYGHPVSAWLNRRTMWRRIPATSESSALEWIEFSRVSGGLMADVEYSDELYV